MITISTLKKCKGEEKLKICIVTKHTWDTIMKNLNINLNHQDQQKINYLAGTELSTKSTRELKREMPSLLTGSMYAI